MYADVDGEDPYLTYIKVGCMEMFKFYFLIILVVKKMYIFYSALS